MNPEVVYLYRDEASVDVASDVRRSFEIVFRQRR